MHFGILTPSSIKLKGIITIDERLIIFVNATNDNLPQAAIIRYHFCLSALSLCFWPEESKRFYDYDHEILFAAFVYVYIG